MIVQDHDFGICHHKQTSAYRNMFVKHVRSLYQTYLKHGNVFMDNQNTFYDITTGITWNSAAVHSIRSLEENGKVQCKQYVQTQEKARMKKPAQVKDLKDLVATLSQLYIANQVRGGDTLKSQMKTPSVTIKRRQNLPWYLINNK